MAGEGVHVSLPDIVNLCKIRDDFLFQKKQANFAIPVRSCEGPGNEKGIYLNFAIITLPYFLPS